MSKDLKFFENFTGLPPELQSLIFGESDATKHVPLLSKELRDTLKNIVISEYILNTPTKSELDSYISTRPVLIAYLDDVSGGYDPLHYDEDRVMLASVVSFTTDVYSNTLPVGYAYVSTDENGLSIAEANYDGEIFDDIYLREKPAHFFDVMTMKYVIGERLKQFSIMDPVHHAVKYFNYVIDELKNRAPPPVLYLYIRENARMLFIHLTEDELKGNIDTLGFQHAIERLYPLIINRLME